MLNLLQSRLKAHVDVAPDGKRGQNDKDFDQLCPPAKRTEIKKDIWYDYFIDCTLVPCVYFKTVASPREICATVAHLYEGVKPLMVRPFSIIILLRPLTTLVNNVSHCRGPYFQWSPLRI